MKETLTEQAQPVIVRTAVKGDRGKPPLALIPSSAKLVEALAFADGLAKYGMFNYLKGGLTAIQLLSAVQRHIDAYLAGEQIAPDSGIHHLGHARAGLGMVIDLEVHGKLVDDRYKDNEDGNVSSES